MSKLGEKLHSVILRLRGGIDVAKHDIDGVVEEVTSHLSETVVPAIEAKVKEILADVETQIKGAVSEALQAERNEAKRLAAEIQAAYQKLAQEHGHEAADKAVLDASAAAAAPAAPAAEEAPSA